MTYAHVLLQGTHRPVNRIICSCPSISGTHLVSWSCKWCVEVEAGPSIVPVSVSAIVSRLGREMGPGYESNPMALR